MNRAEQPGFIFGQTVLVTAGAARGKRGVVLGRAGWDWSKDEPQYRLQIPGTAGESTIRASFLEPEVAR